MKDFAENHNLKRLMDMYDYYESIDDSRAMKLMLDLIDFEEKVTNNVMFESGEFKK